MTVPPRPRRALLLAAIAAGLLLTVLAIVVAGKWASREALAELSRQAQGTAQLNTLALRTYLEKFRAIPRVLADDPEVQLALRWPDAQEPADVLNHKLERLNRDIAASVIYLLRTDGLAIAASNWQEPISFVGESYRFRPYFQQAMATGQAEYFALGTVSQEPGLYLSRRIDSVDGTMLGVIVLKMSFAALEQDWGRLGQPVYVTGPHGVVVISNIPGWRFRTLAPLPDATTQALRESRQFGDAALQPLPLEDSRPITPQAQLTRATAALPHAQAGDALLHVSQAVDGAPDMTLHLLAPVQPRLRRARTNAQLYALLAMAALGALAGFGYHRRRSARRQAREQARRNQELEAQVRQRTQQLNQSNRELVAQMDERQRAEARLHQMQDELVQANKLTLLGQVTAGVAHEINQPLAAIRNYADNAAAFLQRADTETVRGNLQNIARLTDRIGGITGELRGFSRKQGSGVAAIALADALDGALMLASPRIKREHVQLDYEAPPPSLRVWADRMRLEQVFVNLLQNALDAMAAGREPAARLGIIIETHSDSVSVSIRDNGPGLPDEVRARLFTPFHSTKPDGLGLGLVISRDLLVEFGATLHAATHRSPASGACFIVTLRRDAGQQTED